MSAAIGSVQDRAALYGLRVGCTYLYITKDYEEHHSRPDKGYTYTAAVEICRPDEKNEERKICFYLDLLYVRLGKTTYRGTKNKTFSEDLREEAADILNDIEKTGFEAYIENY